MNIIPENDYINEKINDIYVNRNVGQLYSNGRKPNKQKSIAATTAYDSNSYGNTYKGFYLHNPSNNNNEKLLNDSKIYNAFSKQKIGVPMLPENKRKIDGHNEYSMGNVPSATLIRAKHTPIENWNMTDTFEDDEFASILGYI